MEQQVYLVDTNVFLEFLLKQERRSECLRVLRNIEAGSLQAYVTSFSLHSIAVVLEREGKVQGLVKFLDWVTTARGLKVYHTTPLEEKQAAEAIKKSKLDFDDALQYHVTHTLGASLISFDRDFDRTDIQRLEPADVVGAEGRERYS